MCVCVPYYVQNYRAVRHNTANLVHHYNYVYYLTLIYINQGIGQFHQSLPLYWGRFSNVSLRAAALWWWHFQQVSHFGPFVINKLGWIPHANFMGMYVTLMYVLLLFVLLLLLLLVLLIYTAGAFISKACYLCTHASVGTCKLRLLYVGFISATLLMIIIHVASFKLCSEVNVTRIEIVILDATEYEVLNVTSLDAGIQVPNCVHYCWFCSLCMSITSIITPLLLIITQYLCMSINPLHCLFTSPLLLCHPPWLCSLPSLHCSLPTSLKSNTSFGAVTLEGEAPLTSYQRALYSLTYELQPSGEPPCPLERAIDVTVYGGRLVIGSAWLSVLR